MSAFDRLHPALQHHIVNYLGWRSLRPVQELAIDAVLADANAIVLAPTAGGKTEAAFFPLISRTLASAERGVSVLYVSPIKALLNNQVGRLEHYYGLVGRRAAVWHGDVTPARKRRLQDDPPDCLLTTPESLEVMLVSGGIRSDRLFTNVRSIVIDEVHAFAGDDRGCHLMAVLSRISRLDGRDIQRIGLSATVGNTEELLTWLSTGSQRTRMIVRPPSSDSGPPDVEIDYVGSLRNAGAVIAGLHQGEKRLVFCDSRSRVEDLASELRGRGVETFVSHSSLGLDERRQAEEAFAQGRNCVIVSTSSLELGIDVGDLDRVIQIDAPATVSSFLQRMGRTGRRDGSRRNCLFLATDEQPLMRAAGLIHLWRQGYVEPVRPPPLPLHIFAQQVMALALQEGGITRSAWKEWLGGAPAFQNLPDATADELISHMLAHEILWDDNGLIWLGSKGQDEFGRRHFLELFSVFTSPPQFTVLYGNRELGSVHDMTFLVRADGPAVLLLAGRSWRVTDLDWKRRRAQVEPDGGEGRSRWRGQGQILGFALCRAVRELLASDALDSCWSRRATEKLVELRAGFAPLSTTETAVVRSDSGEIHWWTFAGGRANAGLAHTLSQAASVEAESDNFAVVLKSGAELDAVLNGIRRLQEGRPQDIVPAVNDEAVDGLKFSVCLPAASAHAVVAARASDIDGTTQVLREPLRVVVTQD